MLTTNVVLRSCEVAFGQIEARRPMRKFALASQALCTASTHHGGLLQCLREHTRYMRQNLPGYCRVLKSYCDEGGQFSHVTQQRWPRSLYEDIRLSSHLASL